MTKKGFLVPPSCTLNTNMNIGLKIELLELMLIKIQSSKHYISSRTDSADLCVVFSYNLVGPS